LVDAPETITLSLDKPMLMIPRIAKRLRAIPIPAGVLPINHNLTVVQCAEECRSTNWLGSSPAKRVRLGLCPCPPPGKRVFLDHHEVAPAHAGRLTRAAAPPAWAGSDHLDPSPMDTLSVSATPELRRFKMHPKLLMDVIRRQAGTLGKAIVEGVQNSIDAQATGVDITTERGRVVISDDGGGFPSRDEIEKFFEVFGQPHDASERKVYGTFRMGRGQMFAFGRNQWRSGQFAMEVDIEKFGLDYQLHAGLEAAPGCRIEIALYEPSIPFSSTTWSAASPSW